MTYSAEQLLTAFAKTRSALDGGEVTLWWSGDVYAWAPDLPYQRVLGFEGINVSRLVAVEGGYEMLSREVACYLDPHTRQVIDRWANPFTGSEVDVLHVWNDPANQRWLLNGPRGPLAVPMTRLGDQVCFHLEIPLAYPSPLPVADFPDNSAGDTYRALELYQFFTSASVFDDPGPSVPHHLSWMRMSPWLPWMRMGQRAGGLTFHCRGRKLESYADTPEWLREFIAAHQPRFASAPARWAEPNETSWTYFRRVSAR